ncbi:MAG: hypothetical protein GY796_34660 [Chloroflexi bacterium]|nr:hypothetical protein [Chloroflexota bacterium]
MHVEAISNGMGSQSVYLLVLAIEGHIECDVSVSADTGSENDRVWSTGERTSSKEYFERVIYPLATKNGIDAVFVRAKDKDGQELPAIVDLLKKGKTAGVPLFGDNGGRLNQSCTSKYKIRAVRQELRKIGAKTARVALGLTVSEVERIKPSDVKWCENYWPLVEFGVYRSEIQARLTQAGIPFLLSTECDFCPHKDKARWDRTARDMIDEIEKIEDGLPGLFFTSNRIPIKESIKKQNSGQLEFGCDDGGYCWV